MRTTVNLEPEAYRLARALASQRNLTVGKVLSDAILDQFRPMTEITNRVEIDADGFPTLRLGRVITPEDVAAAIEDE